MYTFEMSMLFDIIYIDYLHIHLYSYLCCIDILPKNVSCTTLICEIDIDSSVYVYIYIYVYYLYINDI